MQSENEANLADKRSNRARLRSCQEFDKSGELPSNVPDQAEAA
jgi:hypothetical protein